ncbi:MAG: glycosyltransferase family 2 protein [Deltaproteobacteria bacterium]|nr:glycosyltransferase family 2 protein [Deltaproteobacteria bacterium]
MAEDLEFFPGMVTTSTLMAEDEMDEREALESRIPKAKDDLASAVAVTRGRPTLSVAVIALNEADRIERLLKSVRFADEILVVDSGSTDGTQALCRSYGAEVIDQPWMGYVAQKQFALEKANSEWVLSLDADEVVSEALAKEIVESLGSAPPEVVGFSIPRLSNYLRRWIRHGGWYPDRNIRMARKGRARWGGIDPHDKLAVDGRTLCLSQPILHFVYRNISDQLATIDRFSSIIAGRKGPASGIYLLAGLGHALAKFAECYLWKMGFLDGWAGLVIAMNSTWYVFLKYAKAWEIGLNENNSSRP